MMRTLTMWLFVVACGGQAATTPKPQVPPAAEAEVDKPVGAREDVSIEAFVPLQSSGVQIVDVRTPGEWDAGHVPGAVHVPLADLSADHPELVKLDKAKPVYFICQSGGRSGRAADAMSAEGFHAVNVLGGTGAWMAAGHEVE